MAWTDRVDGWFDRLWDRFRRDDDDRRREDDAEGVNDVTVIDDGTGEDGDTDRDDDTSNEIDGGVEVEDNLPLRILAVDPQAKRNSVPHHCEKYELVERGSNKTVVVRRGGAMNLAITLNKKVNLKKTQRLTFTFSFGPRPNVVRGTKEILELGGKTTFDHSPGEDWDARVASTDGDKVEIEVQISATAPVGVWRLSVTVTERKAGTPHIPTPTDPRPPPGQTHTLDLSNDVEFYILYNPWSKHDHVYLENEEQRDEYVLTDVGKIWVGNYPRARGRQWVFGQFDDAVLPACVLMLERSGLTPEQRGDPVLVTRAISRIVNSNDDRGVVQGKWSEPYSAGTAPTGWTGSIKILEEYMRKQRPVKYGQCWVFSGVVTTVCRALGIPCRSVSNLNSAHDTNVSLTIDEYFDEKGEDYTSNPDATDPAGLGDSIWNFHVWNDVWMARPDLPSGYGGWQAIDSTPQERSNGLYQCGPASLEAVRRGQPNLPYDVPFVLAEVNADLVRWQQDETAKNGFKKLKTFKTHIGRQVLTKLPGEMAESSSAESDRQDITTDYKAPEGTDTERLTLYGAARHFRSARHAFRFPSVAEMDVEFTLQTIETVDLGDDYSVGVTMQNKSDSVRTVSLSLSSSSEYYTGVKAHLIRRAEGTFTLEPEQEQSLQLPITYAEYFSKLVEHGTMKILAIANVKETTQSWIEDDKFQLLKPEMKIDVPATAVVGVAVVVRVQFVNPLQEPLTEAYIVVDGPGLTRPKRINVSTVAARAKFRHSLRMYPKRAGTGRSLVVTFSSKQLTDIMGSAKITITPQEE